MMVEHIVKSWIYYTGPSDIQYNMEIVNQNIGAKSILVIDQIVKSHLNLLASSGI